MIRPNTGRLLVRVATETVTPGGIHVPATASKRWHLTKATVEAVADDVNGHGLYLGAVVWLLPQDVTLIADDLGFIKAEHVYGAVTE